VSNASAETVDRLRAAGCVFAEDEAQLLTAAAPTPARLEQLVDRRVAGEPLEYIVGWVAFHGRRLEVDPGVFVPRQRTELLVEQARLRASSGSVVVDLCCGNGAIGATLAALVPGIVLHASDLDPSAVRCARRNLRGLDAHVYEGDLFGPLPPALRGGVDVLVANVPYVPSDAVASMPPEARDHEPLLALDGGADGLDVLRRVATAAPIWLAATGQLLIETSRPQAPAAAQIFAAAGLAPVIVADDERAATVVIGSR
jgi:release factor glutamine methyltransferase